MEKKMSKVKLKSSTLGHTKARRTNKKKVLRTFKSSNLTIRSNNYSVPKKIIKELENRLAPHLIEDSSDNLSFDEFCKADKRNLPSWAENIRGLRYRENLTQVQFADVLEITQANLSAMENGKRPIGKQIAKRIQNVFNIDYRRFL